MNLTTEIEKVTSILHRTTVIRRVRQSQPINDQVRAIRHKIEPIWRIDQVDSTNHSSFQTHNAKQNGSLDTWVGHHSIPPYLSIAIDGASSIYIDIRSSKLPKKSSALVRVLESINEPEVDIGREADFSLDYDVYCLEES